MLNKKTVDKMLTHAYKFLSNCSEFLDSQSKSTYRGYVASFGTAADMSGFGTAAAFFSEEIKEGGGKTRTKEDRTVITKGILEIIKLTNNDNNNYGSLYDYVKKNRRENVIPRNVKEDIENAAIALRLAMNLFDLGYGKKNTGSETEAK